MPDSLSLRIGDIEVRNFLSFSIEADLYTADHAFSLELANPGVPVKCGQRCELAVNDDVELTGIIDRRALSGDKKSKTLRVEGRDLMGLLVDSHCETFPDIEGKKLSALASMLLANVPFIQRSDVRYQADVAGRLKRHKAAGKSSGGFLAETDTAQKNAKIEPGMSVFEVLKEFAASRGMMFWGMPDGTFEFGRPMVSGDPAFSLIRRKDGRGNNIIKGELTEDFSKRYSKVTVIGQSQESGLGIAGANNPPGIEIDKDFPFKKPFVAKNNNDSRSPQLHARFLLEKMQSQGFRLTYTVKGFSDGFDNWKVNELCRVVDEDLDIDGTYLIHGRTFELSRTEGAVTRLKLGMPGVIQ
jgi:prophage tail gpP-like protein